MFVSNLDFLVSQSKLKRSRNYLYRLSLEYFRNNCHWVCSAVPGRILFDFGPGYAKIPRLSGKKTVSGKNSRRYSTTVKVHSGQNQQWPKVVWLYYGKKLTDWSFLLRFCVPDRQLLFSRALYRLSDQKILFWKNWKTTRPLEQVANSSQTFTETGSAMCQYQPERCQIFLTQHSSLRVPSNIQSRIGHLTN